MFLSTKKVVTFVIIILSLLGVISSAFAWEYYPTSYYWDFQNYCYLGFNESINFAVTPNQGVPPDSSLVGYWNLNEGSGLVTHDISGNGNNGTIYGASWVTGKYINALSFNGATNYVDCGKNACLDITGNVTISAWVKLDSSWSSTGIICIKSVGSNWGQANYYLRVNTDRTVAFIWGDGASASTNYITLTTTSALNVNTWYHIVAQWDKIFINGISVKISTSGNATSHTTASNNPLLIGCASGTSGFFNGVIDEVRVYNRALSAVEVAELYMQPDPVSLANYYNYKDPITNNTMLVHVNNPNVTSNNTTLVTCINFFAGNKLVFQANNSATVNVWTNLGQPAFTTGACVWNSENFTTTLALDASSTAELNWNTYNITIYVDAHSGVLPSNVTVSYGGSQTFNFNASQGYRFNVVVDGVSQGQISSYTFSNVTAPHSVNVTSALLKYTVTASGDSGSTISPSGDVSVNYGGSQLFTIQNKTGYNVKHVYVDNADKGAISNYTFSNVTANHVISVSSESLSSTNSSTTTPTPSPTPTASTAPTPVPSQSPGLTSLPSPTPTSQQETNQFPTQTAVLAVIAVATLIAGFALAFKKGYITIETVDEENPEEKEPCGNPYDDETIGD